jgi:hypothetical protein
MPLSVTIAGKQSLVVTPIGATIPVAIVGNDIASLNLYFKKALVFAHPATQADVSSQAQACVDFLRLHVDEIMFNSSWQPWPESNYPFSSPPNTYLYDLSANPSWNFANGARSNYLPQTLCALNFNEWTPKIGQSGVGLNYQQTELNPSYTWGTGPYTELVCAYVCQIYYPGILTHQVKTITRIAGTGILGDPPLSASILKPYWDGGGGTFPAFPPSPTQDVVVSNPMTIDAPIDQDGAHVGQVLQVPIPDSLGVFTITSATPNYYIFGESFLGS